VTIDVILIKTNHKQTSEPSSKFVYIPISYSQSIKCNSIGKEIAPTNNWGLNTTGGGEKMKNFDQWTEELLKQVFVQTDEDNVKVLYKAKEIYVEDDFEEEE
jgi:hypothetical protein